MAGEKARARSSATIVREALRLFSLADTEKMQFQPDFREIYSFTMPHRVRPGTSTTTKPRDAQQNFSSIGPQVTADFASDFADTFLPEHARWATGTTSILVDDKAAQGLSNQLREALKNHDDILFDAIPSAFYTAVKQGAKDLSVSAAGIVIQDPGMGAPIHCQAIPLTELWILRGPKGSIDVRFWKRMRTVDQLAFEFPGVDLRKFPSIWEAARKNKNTKITVLQGCYRAWDVPGDTAWHVCTIFDKELVDYSMNVGEGSAPILVMRWDPEPGFSWGIGPGLKALPDYRTVDEISYQKLKGMARRNDPSFFYDDDGVINLDGGIPNGVGIPRATGSTFDVIESSHGGEEAAMSEADYEHRIRRHYFLDEPQQEGKTPPTLGQWMDESVRRQKRLSSPTAPIWDEFISEAYLRFRLLLVKRGELDPRLQVGSRAFPLRPINPLKRAAQQEDAATSERFLMTLNALVPQGAVLFTDLGKTLTKLQEQSGSNGVTLMDAGTITATQKLIVQAIATKFAAEIASAAAPAMQVAQNGGGAPQQ